MPPIKSYYYITNVQIETTILGSQLFFGCENTELNIK